MTTKQGLPVIEDQEASQAAASALATFVACAQLMLDAATPEALRRQAESRLLTQLPVVRALGVFELFSVRDPALAALLHDELELLTQRDARNFPHVRRA